MASPFRLPAGALTLLALPLAALTFGCEPSDPVWDLPCDQRPARSVIPGTGEGSFHVIDDNPLPIEYGSQGGQHIWVGVRIVGFGPEASVLFGIRDADDPDIVYSGPNTEHLELHYNSDAEASEAYGIYGYLDSGYDPETGESDSNPSGKRVVVWAQVGDACGETAEGETEADVQ